MNGHLNERLQEKSCPVDVSCCRDGKRKPMYSILQMPYSLPFTIDKHLRPVGIPHQIEVRDSSKTPCSSSHQRVLMSEPPSSTRVGDVLQLYRQEQREGPEAAEPAIARTDDEPGPPLKGRCWPR